MCPDQGMRLRVNAPTAAGSQTQLTAYQALLDLPEEHHKNLWGTQTYYRAFSLVNSGRKLEQDLFEGLHDEFSGTDTA